MVRSSNDGNRLRISILSSLSAANVSSPAQDWMNLSRFAFRSGGHRLYFNALSPTESSRIRSHCPNAQNAPYQRPGLRVCISISLYVPFYLFPCVQLRSTSSLSQPFAIRVARSRTRWGPLCFVTRFTIGITQSSGSHDDLYSISNEYSGFNRLKTRSQSEFVRCTSPKKAASGNGRKPDAV